MLTREQKAWIVAGFCNTFDGCDTDCPLNKQCASSFREFDDFNVAQLDECLKIIAPELVDTPKPAAASQWISVEDKLPDRFKPVIVCYTRGKGTLKALRVEQGYKGFNDCWNVYGCQTKSVTHWMPMPEPPEVERNE